MAVHRPSREQGQKRGGMTQVAASTQPREAHG
jgi:hypothetical protein